MTRLEDRGPLQGGVQQDAVEILHEKQVAAAPEDHPAPVCEGLAGEKIKDFIFRGKPNVGFGRGLNLEGRQGCEGVIFADIHWFGCRTFPGAACAQSPKAAQRRTTAWRRFFAWCPAGIHLSIFLTRS